MKYQLTPIKSSPKIILETALKPRLDNGQRAVRRGERGGADNQATLNAPRRIIAENK